MTTPQEAIEELFADGQELVDAKPAEAIEIFIRVINDPSTTEAGVKVREAAIYALGNLYVSNKNVAALRQLLEMIKPFYASIPKARTAKIVRTIIELVAKIPNTTAVQIELCQECIKWAQAEKRTFLRQRIQSKLGSLFLQTLAYQDALNLVTPLLREVKKMEDKPLMVELHLLESQIFFALRNIARAKAALTSARSCANSIYCPPSQQTLLDIQSGILHAEEGDFKTAYSYFFEAFESYTTMDILDKGVNCLKYMLLCKVMMNNAEDIQSIISGKLGVRYAGRDVEAMKAVSKAYTSRSLKDLEAALKEYKHELLEDAVVESHLIELKENLLQQNLCRLIEPFSKVQISHIAQLIDLPLNLVERKLSQMILDKQFHGILDQGAGCLIVFDNTPQDDLYLASADTIKSMNKVVDSLYSIAKGLN